MSGPRNAWTHSSWEAREGQVSAYSLWMVKQRLHKEDPDWLTDAGLSAADPAGILNEARRVGWGGPSLFPGCPLPSLLFCVLFYFRFSFEPRAPVSIKSITKCDCEMPPASASSAMLQPGQLSCVIIRPLASCGAVPVPGQTSSFCQQRDELVLLFFFPHTSQT